MKKKQGQSEGKKRSLHKRAEELLVGRFENLDKVSEADIQGLIRELQVHRMELEIQNEELRRAQSEIEESRNRYASLYDFAPVGYFTLDEKSVILEVNFKGAALLGVEKQDLIGQTLYRYISEESKGVFYLYRERLKSTARRTCELKMLRGGRMPFYAQLEGLTVFNDEEDFYNIRI